MTATLIALDVQSVWTVLAMMVIYMASLIQKYVLLFLSLHTELFEKSFILIYPLQFSSWHNISCPALREMVNAFNKNIKNKKNKKIQSRINEIRCSTCAPGKRPYLTLWGEK